jgi:hypothetical protein
MQGYEKVNKRRVDRRAFETLPVGDSLVSPPAKKRPKPRRRLVDLSALAAESPAESIARENEIVQQLALQTDYAERASRHSIAEQLLGLVDPQVIRSL